MHKLLTIIGVVLCLCWGEIAQVFLHAQQAQTPPDAQAIQRTNWLLYVYEETAGYRFTRLLPFYSYTTYPDRFQDEFWFWPLLAGYEVAKTPAPTPFPYGLQFHWYTLPFLTLGKAQVNPEQELQTSTLVSLLLMTYFQERQIQDKYFSRSWYSLPFVSYYHSENLREENTEIANTTCGNPLFSWSDIRIIRNRQLFPVYEWALQPLALLLGNDSCQLLHNARWGRDYLLDLFSLDPFALFSIRTTFSQYPGEAYHRFAKFSTSQTQGLQELFTVPLAFPKSRLGILSPLLVFESSPGGLFSWQFLPFFAYSAQNGKSHFYILPLALEIGSDGLAFSPQPKFFPLLYHDAMYGSWDILWPIFQYVANPVFPWWRFTARFLLDYQYQEDAQGRPVVDFSLVERLLCSYRSTPDSTVFEILPNGILFGYYHDTNYYQWRFLGFGYLENAQSRFLQLFFIQIPMGS